MAVRKDRAVYPLKLPGRVSGVVTDLQRGGNTVHAARIALLHIVLQRGQNDGRAHRMAADANLAGVDISHVFAHIVDYDPHISKI